MINATSIYGNNIALPKSKFTLRISGYGIVLHEEKVLLVDTHATNKWCFPGGAVEIGEKVEHAIKREIKEETGITVEVGEFLDVIETFWYYDPADKAFQNYSFFYRCTPGTFELSEQYQHDATDESNSPEWVTLSTLLKSDFQQPADQLFRKLQELGAA
jgi:mutator protein MutT